MAEEFCQEMPDTVEAGSNNSRQIQKEASKERTLIIKYPQDTQE
jgi:hypothetical protein